jgi:hypothetical protein
VTFAEQSDGVEEGRRERSLVGERAREIEGRLANGDGEGEEAVMGSSVMSKESEDGELVGSEGGEEIGVDSGARTMGTNSEVVED